MGSDAVAKDFQHSNIFDSFFKSVLVRNFIFDFKVASYVVVHFDQSDQRLHGRTSLHCPYPPGGIHLLTFLILIPNDECLTSTNRVSKLISNLGRLQYSFIIVIDEMK